MKKFQYRHSLFFSQIEHTIRWFRLYLSDKVLSVGLVVAVGAAHFPYTSPVSKATFRVPP